MRDRRSAIGIKRDNIPGDFGSNLERKIVMARLALAWEALWPRLWRIVALVGAFLCISLFDLWSWMPGWFHFLLLTAFGGGLAILAYRAIMSFDAPVRHGAVRRIERINNLDHRPLSALEDSPAIQGDRATRVYWSVHRARLKAKLGNLRTGWPAPQLVRHDPYGLRAVIGLGLIIGFAASGPDWPDRIARAFSPSLAQASGAITFEAWVTPPGYTHIAPIFLTRLAVEPASSGEQDAVVIPAGSKFTARLHGGRRAPITVIDGEAVEFETVETANYHNEIELTGGSSLSVIQDGVQIASWPIRIIADEAPQIGFLSPPAPTLRKALKIEYRATDDYGVVRADLRMVLAEPLTGAGSTAEQTLIVTLVEPSGSPKEIEDTNYNDLTAHPWAGLNVTARLVAEDALGQKGSSQPTILRLPERIFTHPVAQELVALRKHLVRDPSAGDYARRRLDQIAERPSRFNDDSAVYMGLRSAFWRLTHSPGQETVDRIVELLWDLALRIEDGDMLLAERDLRDALEELEAAIENGASPEEIEELTNRVEAALSRFLRALAEKARDQEFEQAEAGDQSSQTIGSETFQEMLDQLRSLNRLGAHDAAKKLLSNLRNILENLRAGPTPSGNQLAEALSDALRGIDQVMRDEQGLIDKTEDVAIERGEGASEDENRDKARGLAQSQEDVRRQLEEALKQLGQSGGQVPGAIDRADRAMDDARQSLERGNLGSAMQSESEALQALREGAGEIAKALSEAASGQASGGLGGSAVDPLGRPLNGQADLGEDGFIPREWEMQRARQILEELQRRANDRGRPLLERDYIERLLKRF